MKIAKVGQRLASVTIKVSPWSQMEMRFDGSIFAPFHTLIACLIERVILSQDSSTISGKIIVLKSMFLRHTQHFCEGSSESSSRWAIIRAEIEPQPRPCWNNFAGSRQLAREGRQHGTWHGGAVANPQLIVATFRVEVEKLHFDNEAPCHTDAPNAVLSVGVIVRVVRACKLPNVLSTDGQWTSWKRKTSKSKSSYSSRFTAPILNAGPTPSFIFSCCNAGGCGTFLGFGSILSSTQTGIDLVTPLPLFRPLCALNLHPQSVAKIIAHQPQRC